MPGIACHVAVRIVFIVFVLSGFCSTVSAQLQTYWYKFVAQLEPENKYCKIDRDWYCKIVVSPNGAMVFSNIRTGKEMEEATFGGDFFIYKELKEGLRVYTYRKRPEPPPELTGLNSFLSTPDYFLFILADYSEIRYDSHNIFKGLVYSRIGIKCEEPIHLLKENESVK